MKSLRYHIEYQTGFTRSMHPANYKVWLNDQTFGVGTEAFEHIRECQTSDSLLVRNELLWELQDNDEQFV